MANQLQESLALLSNAMGSARDPWWIIGSAAVNLLGGDPGEIADVDVIVSRGDLERLYDTLPLKNDPDNTKIMFASEMFGRWSETPLNVEFMAGLKVNIEGRWHEVQPSTRLVVTTGATSLFVPEAEEMINILKLFGRAKDLRRAASLARD